MVGTHADSDSVGAVNTTGYGGESYAMTANYATGPEVLTRPIADAVVLCVVQNDQTK